MELVQELRQEQPEEAFECDDFRYLWDQDYQGYDNPGKLVLEKPRGEPPNYGVEWNLDLNH